MRKTIAALQVSADGFIEGPNGELDWAMAQDEESWRDFFEMLRSLVGFDERWKLDQLGRRL
jgi:hypothetical protein